MITIELPFAVKRPILACGADLKGTFALAKGRRSYLFDGFGDLSDPDNLERYERAVRAHCKKLDITPRIVACDMHPRYFSRRFAVDYTLHASHSTLHEVQHHEAHIASVIADSGVTDRVIGAAFDGTGYGPDGNIWGGEFFIGGLAGFRRAGHLQYAAMPGGEAAIREPWRMAESLLYAAGLKAPPPIIKTMIDRNINSPLTSSAGRLFDAVASLILSKKKSSYEAELPTELERMAKKALPQKGSRPDYGFDVVKAKGISVVKTGRMMKGIIKDMASGAGKDIMAARFHNTMAEIILKMCAVLKKKTLIKKVVLSGGVFRNGYLRERSRTLLEEAGFFVYLPGRISPDDSCLPLGQLAIASARDACA